MSHPEVIATSGLQRIPLRTSKVGHIHLDGSVNGQAVDVLVDSGAASTVADRDWAAASGFVMRSLTEKGAGAGAATLDLALMESAELTIGNVRLAGVPLIAIDMSNVRAGLKAKGAEPPQLILGADVLHRWRAVIDYSSSSLWLSTAG